MSAPDYSGTAVTVRAGDGPNPVSGLWRNVCPVDCGWHGSDWDGRVAAEDNRGTEAKHHKCLRTGTPEESQP